MALIVLNPVAESPPRSEALDLMKSDSLEQSAQGAEVPACASSSCKKARVEDSDVSSIDDQDELLPRPVRKKRPNRRYKEWSSDDEYCLRALKRSFPKYKEASSSESESDFSNLSREATPNPTGLPVGVVRGCLKCVECQVVLARWRPEEGRKPCVPDAPVFYPTEEEFKDTLKYIAKIRSTAEPFGICRVVPPQGWQPPCPLREDSSKLHVLKFPTRVQEIHKLQVRRPVKKCSQTKQRLGGRRGRGGFRGRMGRPCRTPNLSTIGGPIKPVQPDESFGFEPGSYFSIGMFEKYAQQFKTEYFMLESADELQDKKSSEYDWTLRMNPSVDAIEAEYWRIVERPTEQIEVLYGADVETGSFASGFPKTKSRDGIADPNSYEKSGWNLNNIARLPGSILSFEEGDISGVLVPWLYIGMCFSSFCWHVEDHHFYSLNYLHWGAPKVWYGVAGRAAQDMEAMMKKHLPDLFDEQPDLLHKLVTQLSPSILREEGLPVYRLVQQAGEFVITFPRAYHSGFNCGFNCAEAVNLAPVDWLPHGQSAVELYREQRRKTSVSHDKLLIAAAREAVSVLLQDKNDPIVSKIQGHLQHETRECEKITAQGGKDILYPWQASCGQGGVLAKALKARVEMERFRQASLTGEVQMKKMDSCYDATDERECAECHYDLHLSAVGCECCPEKYVCLAHAELLCVCQWGKKSVLHRYDLAQLELLVSALEGHPRALSTWFEYEQCSSSASSVSTISSFPNVSHRSSLVHSLGPCEFNSTEFPCDKTRFKGEDIEVNLSRQAGYLSFNPGALEASGNPLSNQWCKGMYTEQAVPFHSSGGFVHNIAVVQPVPRPVVSVLEERKTNVGGLRSRVQLGKSSETCLQNVFVKFEKQIAETSVLKGQQEVIVLSDDEELGVTVRSAEVSFNAKLLEGNNVGSHTLSGTTAVWNTGRVTALQKVETGIAHSFTSPEGKPLVSEGLNGVVPEKLQTLGSVIPHPSVNIPCSTFVRVPSIPLAPLSIDHELVRNRLSSEAPSRARSIINLKQQARHFGWRSHGSRAEDIQPVNTIHGSAVKLFGRDSASTPCQVRSNRSLGPRVAKVVRKKVCYDVELINVGSLVLRRGWYDKHSIFPSGFRSRVCFCSVLDILRSCFYVSEIVEGGQVGPCFKVSVEGNSETVFIGDSMDECWQAVQEQINTEIIRRRYLGEANLPSLQPPQSLNGLDMFGLTSAAIIQAVEAIDAECQCFEYWTTKRENMHPTTSCYPPAHASEHRPSTPEEVHVRKPKGNGANVKVTDRPASPMATMVTNGVSGGHPLSGDFGLYSVLKGFFQKGKLEELCALHRVFNCDWQGDEWREGLQALTDVLGSQDS